MSQTWIVIAHRTGARIVERSGEPLALAMVREVTHEEGRKHSGELDTDSPGMAFSRVGSGGGHPMATEETAHDHVAKVFAKRLADELGRDRNEHRFDKLVLVAEPRFLGFLREALDEQTASLVTGTVTKDLAKVELKDLGEHLSPWVHNSYHR